MKKLKGKNCFITGAGGILGSRCAAGLAENGANLILLDLFSEPIEKLKKELTDKHDIKVLTITCDISNEEDVIKAVKTVEDELGDIHVLHNNAATKSEKLEDFFAPFEKFDLQSWRDIMSVNIDGMFLVAKHVGNHMVERNIKGSIIQTSSIYGITGPDQRIYDGALYMGVNINTPAVYSVSKAAVVGLTKYLATYWGDKGIRVNTLVPGGIESGQNDTFIKNYSARVPMGRMAQVDEVADAMIFLASESSTYITGQSIIVDGGLSTW